MPAATFTCTALYGINNGTFLTMQVSLYNYMGTEIVYL